MATKKGVETNKNKTVSVVLYSGLTVVMLTLMTYFVYVAMEFRREYGDDGVAAAWLSAGVALLFLGVAAWFIYRLVRSTSRRK